MKHPLDLLMQRRQQAADAFDRIQLTGDPFQAQAPRRPWLRRFARGFTLLFALQTVLGMAPAYAQVVASPTAGAGARPIVDQARNGADIVHISPPNASGISRNQYDQFNAGGNGLILNNSAQNTNTMLGGWIAGNPQLGLQPARIILNEVTSANPSALRGTIEVGGQRADIIIANPNGIQCDGCGFLNAGRATLTTGGTQFNTDGSLRGFGVERGTIDVGPGGLDARGLEQLDLLARGIVIEGEVWGQRINAIAGANQVLYGDVTAVSGGGGPDGAPRFAIDIRDVGGMYARQVYMVATDKGVGVNSSGRLAALEGKFTLSADGDLRVQDVYGKQGVELTSSGGDVAVAGNVLSEANVEIAGARAVRNDGTVQSDQRVALAAPVIDNRGVIHQSSTTEDLVLAPGTRLTNSGQIQSASGLRIESQTVQGQGDGQTSAISARRGVSIQAATVALSGQTLSSNQDLLVKGGDVAITSGAVQATGDVAVQASGTLDLGRSQVRSNGRIDATGSTVRLADAGVQASGAVAVGASQDMDAQGARIQGASVQLGASRVSTREAIVVGDEVSVRSRGGPLDNAGGQLVGAHSLSVGGAGIDNTGGRLQAGDRLSLDAGGGALVNDAGTVSAPVATLAGVGQLSNRGGYLATQSDLNLSGPLDNQGGTLNTTGSLSVNTGGRALNNQQGQISAGGGLSLATSGGGLDNQSGSIHAGGALALDTGHGTLNNSAGTVAANGSAAIHAGAIDTDAGTLAAGSGLQLATGSLNASQARIGAGSNLSVDVAGDARLDGATLTAGGSLGMAAQAIHAAGAVATAGADLGLSGQTLAGGTWSAQGNAAVSMQGPVDLTGGALLAGGAAVVSGKGITTDRARVAGSTVSLDAGDGSLSNVGGRIVATGTQAGALAIQAHGVNNQQGTIASAGGAAIDAQGQAFDNRDGTLEVMGDFALSAGSLLNQGGSISTHSDLTLVGQAIDSRGGRLQTGGKLTIDTQGQRLDITDGLLLAEQNADIRAGELAAAGATLAGGTGLTVRADQMELDSGRLISGGAADVQVSGALSARQSQWTAGQALDVGAASIDATQAGFASNEAVSLRADGTLDVTDALVLAQGPQATGVQLQGGRVAASRLRAATDGSLAIGSSSDLALGGAQLQSGQDIRLQAAGPLGLQGATLQSAQNLTATAASVAAADARLSAGHALQATASAGLLELDRAQVLAGAAMDLSGQAGVQARDARIGAVDGIRVASAAGDLAAAGAVLQSQAGGVGVQARSIDLRAAAGAAGQSATGVLAAQDIDLQASQDVRLDGALVASGQAVGIRTQGEVFTAGATVAAGGDASIRGSTLDNRGGSIDAAGSLNIALGGDTLNNHQGRLSGQTGLSITSDAGQFAQVDNAAGLIQTQGALSLATGSLDNRAGQVVAMQSLDLHGGAIDSTDGLLASGGDVGIDTAGAAFSADRARVISQNGRIDLAAGELSLAQATVAAGQAVGVRGTSVRGAGLALGAQAGDAALDVGPGQADLQGAAVQAGGDVRLAAGQADLSRAAVSAGGSIDARTSALRADASQWQAQHDLSVQASQGAIQAPGARWVAAGRVDMAAASGIDVSQGVVGGDRVALDAGTGRLDNQGGTLVASGGAPGAASLTLRGQGLDNQGGRIESAGDLQADAGSGALGNAQGSLLAAGAMALGSQGLDNRQGTIASNGDLAVAARQGGGDPLASQLDNTGGTLRSVQGAVDVHAGNILNPGGAAAGVIAAAGDIALDATGRVDNHANEIVAGRNLTVHAAAAVDNASGRLLALGAASVQGAGIDNAGGQIAANGRTDVTATAGGIDNTAGLLQAGGDLGVHSAGDLAGNQGQMHAGGSLDVQAGAMRFTQGQLSAQGDARLAVAAFDGADSQLASGGALALDAGTGAVQLDRARLAAVGTLGLQGGATRMADAELLSGGDQTLAVQSLAAPRAHLESAGSLAVQASGAIDLGAGQLLASRDVAVAGTGVSIRQAQVAAGQDASITGQDIDAHQAQASAARDLAVVAAGVLDFGGSAMAAGQDLRVGGTRDVVSSGAALQAGRDLDVSVSGLLTLGQADFQYQAGRDLGLSADRIDVAGQSLSARNLSVVARTGELNNEGGSLTAFGELVAQGQGVRNGGGTLAANGQVRVDAGGGTLDNRSGTIYSAEDGIQLAGQQIDNRGGTLAAATTIGMAGGSLDNRGTAIAAGQNLDIRLAGRIDNSAGGQLLAYGTDGAASTVAAAQGIDNQDGQIAAQQALGVDAGAGKLLNSGGTIQSLTDLSVAGQDIVNRGGSIIGRDSLGATARGTLDHAAGSTLGSELGAVRVAAGTLDNTGNTLQSATDLDITAANILNGGDATLAANGRLGITLQGGTLDNRSGLIAANDVSVGGQGSIQNQSSVISGLNSVNLSAGAVDNTSGAIEAGSGGIRIDTRGQRLVNTASGATRGIVSQGDVQIATGSLDNAGGYVGANGRLGISASGGIDNRAGTLLGLAGGSVSAGATLDNTAGSISGSNLAVSAGHLSNTGTSSIYAAGNLSVSAGSIDNSGTHDGSYSHGLLAGGNLSVDAGSIGNAGGAIVALGDVGITAASQLDNRGGKIAGNNVGVATGNLINTGGRIDATQVLSLDAPRFSADGVIAGGAGLTLSTQGDYTNTGTVATNGNLNIRTSGRYTNQGTVSATNQLDLRAASLDNQAGAVIVAASTHIGVTGTVDNAGLINASRGATTIQAATVNNQAGGRIYGASVGISAGQVNNGSNAVIASRAGDLTLTGAVDNAPDGLLLSLNNLTVNGSLRNVGGKVNAWGDIAVSGQLRNENAGLQTVQQTTTTAVNKVYYSDPNNPSVRYAASDIRFVDWNNDGAVLVKPSATYPFTPFGAVPYGSTWLPAPCGDCDDPHQPRYADSDPVWARFNVPPPDFSGLTPPVPPQGGCIVDGGRDTFGICGTYWSDVDAYDAEVDRRRGAALASLQVQLDTFNADLASRRIEDYYVTTVTGQQVTQDVVVASKPGQVVAGGSVTAGGGVNKDSWIIANGRFVSDGAIPIEASTGHATTVDLGNVYLSHLDSCALGFRTCRRNDAPIPVPDIASTSEYKLDVRPLTPPGNDGAPANQAAGAGPAVQAYAVAGQLGAMRQKPLLVAASGTAAGGLSGAAAGGGTVADPSRGGSAVGAPTVAGVLSPGATGSVSGSGAGSAVAAGLAPAPQGPSVSVAGVQTAPVVDQPLRGSVIADGVRAGQAQAIGAVKMQFSQDAAARPLPVIALPSAGALDPAVPPLPTKGLGYLTAVYDGQLQAPANALFRLHPEPGTGYLVETDPAFTGQQNFLSSDYYLDRLGLDGSQMIKRYGDGFAEAQLVDDQVMGLTGRRFISGYADSQSQYRAMMDSGVTVAQQFQLAPGVGLSEAQMQQLTSDVVLMVKDTVTLPDGSQAEALVPRVYLRRPVEGDLSPQGSLVAASDIVIRAPGQEVVNSGTLYAHGGSSGSAGAIAIQANNVINSGTLAGQWVGIKADQDILNTNGQIIGLGSAGKPSVIALQAGRNIELRTTTQDLQYTEGPATATASLAGRIATLSGDQISLQAGQDLIAQGAKIKAGDILLASAGRNVDIGATMQRRATDVQPGSPGYQGRQTYWQQSASSALGSSLEGGNFVGITAGGQIDITGSRIASSAGDVRLQGQGVGIQAAINDSLMDVQSAGSKRYIHAQVGQQTASASQISAAGNVSVIARGDIRIQASGIQAGQDVLIQGAGVRIESALEQSSHTAQEHRKGYDHALVQSSQNLAGGEVIAGRDLAVIANGSPQDSQGDITLKGATLTAGGQASLIASRDVLLQDQQTEHSRWEETYNSSRGLLSSKSTHTLSEGASSLSEGSIVNGGSGVYVQAGRDIGLTGSHLVATQGDVGILAGRDIRIEAGQDSASAGSHTETRRSGIFSSGGLLHIGSQHSSTEQSNESQRAAASSVQAQGGSVAIIAGNTYSQTGSAVLAAGDIGIAARGIEITEARELQRDQFESRVRQSGLSVGVSSPILDAARTAGQLAEASGRSSDSRTQALGAAAAGLYAYNNAGRILGEANALAHADPSNPASLLAGGASVSISLGASRSQSSGQAWQDSAAGSVIRADGNVSLTAAQGDLHVRGSTIEAGQDASLNAKGNLLLEAAENRFAQQSSQSGSSASIGLNIGAGGVGLTVAASNNQGSGSGQGQTYINSQVRAGGSASLQSGGDTALRGAVVEAHQVTADVGGDLTIESLQDRNAYSERSRSSGFSISVPIYGAGAGAGASVSAGRTRIDSNYQSVGEQSAIRAGDGGFQVDVQGDTNLIGGAITSTQGAIDNSRNRFATGGQLSTSDIQNRADYDASGFGVTLGVGSLLGSSGLGMGQDSGNASSSSVASISGVAGNTAARTGDRETGLKPIFDANQARDNVNAGIAVTTEFGRQGAQAVGSYADQQARQLRQQALNETDPARQQALLIEAERWDEGGAYRVAIHTILGGLGGGAGGAAGAAASAAGMPLIGEQIANLNLPEPVRQGLTQIVGAAAGALAGGGAGLAAALNETAHNYVTHSPFAEVRRTVSMENARLSNAVIAACGADTACLAQGFRQNDAYLAQLEAAATLSQFAREGRQLTSQQAQQFAQLAMELMPVVGSSESLAQLITGRQTLTGEEANRFWAAVGLVPVAGGMIARVGNTAVDVARALRAVDDSPGLINDANRLFRQYADDIEAQTGYRLTTAQREALANELRTGNHAVTLTPAENAALRSEFNNARSQLIAQWETNTGQKWPSILVDGRVVPAQAHHVIPVTNAGPSAWWNITPAFRPDHSALHRSGGPLNQLQ